jgi:hypothetical protein
MPVSPGIETVAARVLYFAFAGMSSTWAFAILKSLAKKQGLDLNIPRDSALPPSTPSPE